MQIMTETGTRIVKEVSANAVMMILLTSGLVTISDSGGLKIVMMSVGKSSVAETTRKMRKILSKNQGNKRPEGPNE